jgi:ribosomal protein S18 acetylase RimI-like enzyme
MPDVDLTIREAELSDASEMAALMYELGYETTLTEMETRLISILPDSAYKTYVAMVDGRICGMIGTLAHPSYEHNDFSGRILALVTSGTTRRRGVGRALIAAAEENFARRGITRVALNTRLTRADAHKFYQALGYERNGYRFVKNIRDR